MKKALILLTLILIIVPTLGKSKYSFLKPDKHGKVVKIQVKGKDWTYYKLDRKNPLEIVIDGTVKIRFITRLDMEGYKASDKIDYTIYAVIDGENTHFTRSAKISKGIQFGDTGSGKIGTGEDIYHEFPAGKHKIKLYLGKKDEKVVYVRVLKEDSKIGEVSQRVAYNPYEFTNLVKILVKEKIYDYYRIGPEDSLKLKVIGPATVKVLSRLEYDITMNGDKKYRVQVYEDDALKNTFLLNTVLSDVAIYAEPYADKSLSQGNQFFIEVPAGEHFYTFKILDSGRTILLKFYIPESALDNTP